ncbi:MAG TPA: lipopolysaccharide assembly protein LapA domain-containing protein [Gaiellaceae bacterium]|nr:lipopolysaccharide assembly protein LapA domain-containing protein [Gaiellaceae bacterium]
MDDEHVDEPRADTAREREREFERSWQPKLWLSLAGLILITAYLIAFAVGNTDEARVDFIFAQATTSLIWVILLSLLAGLLAGMLLSQLHARRSYRRAASRETPSRIASGDS